MPSFTAWYRLEPSARSPDIEESLEARLHDPLWLLTRQWQFREWEGEDAASPVSTTVEGQAARISRYAPGPRAAAPKARTYDGSRAPLETVVERENVRGGGAALRLAAEAGLHFWQLLAVHGVGQYSEPYTREYRLDPPGEQARRALDARSLRYVAVVAGRVPDGRKLYNALRKGLRPPRGTQPTLPAKPAVKATHRQAVIKAGRAWLDWYDRLFSQPAAGDSAWNRERLEYTFDVAARLSGSDAVLSAAEYVEGHLDWYSFEVDPAGSLGGGRGVPDSKPVRATAVPAPVTYGGMPAMRWWEFEDARVSFGAVDAGTRDLARLLLIEFALVYGNDFFVIPVELEVGSLCRIDSLVVTDSFGERTRIESAAKQSASDGARWQMFGLTRRPPPGEAPGAAPAELLFLVPALGPSLESEPVEDVLLLRDEMANMAWAVERLVEGPGGHPVDRFEAYQGARQRAEEQAGAVVTPSGSGAVAYRLSTSVPDNWIPLLPVRLPNGDGLRLRRGRVLAASGTDFNPGPQGRLLEPKSDLLLYEEEVPREGARVTRSYQYARWIDGSTHLWLARRKSVGRGEGSSGLRFDYIEEASA
jgi:hypothetical protein